METFVYILLANIYLFIIVLAVKEYDKKDWLSALLFMLFAPLSLFAFSILMLLEKEKDSI